MSDLFYGSPDWTFFEAVGYNVGRAAMWVGAWEFLAKPAWKKFQDQQRITAQTQKRKQIQAGGAL